jgi:peptide chain release factor subunit 1
MAPVLRRLPGWLAQPAPRSKSGAPCSNPIHSSGRLVQVPPNGLVIYCGTILTEENKERKVNIDFEPFKPINTSLYLCDNKFHTEALQELLASDDKFGFIIMDGNGCLYGTLSGNAREVIHKFSVDLPKKHGRGGQSALRFARLRLEKRQNYVTKCAEIATQMFITNDKVRLNTPACLLALLATWCFTRSIVG